MKLIFNLISIHTKLFLILIIISLFTILYMALPRNEFEKIEYVSNLEKALISKDFSNNNKKEITYLDLIQHSLLSEIGIYGMILNPITIRSRILTMFQLFIGYIVLLI